MVQTLNLYAKPELRVFAKETLVRGQPAQIRCFEIEGQTYSFSKGPLTVISLEDEWYEDVKNPALVVEALSSRAEIKADLFTFWQRLPDVEPKYQYHMEWESIAALPITTVDYWFNKQISGRTRS